MNREGVQRRKKGEKKEERRKEEREKEERKNLFMLSKVPKIVFGEVVEETWGFLSDRGVL